MGTGLPLMTEQRKYFGLKSIRGNFYKLTPLAFDII